MWKKPLRDVKKFCTREKKKPSVKIFEKCSFPSREKKNPPVKKSEKVSVKILDRPWKVRKKCAWKRLCHPWKKPKKGRKWLSRALLIFTGKKKNTALPYSLHAGSSANLAARYEVPSLCNRLVFIIPGAPPKLCLKLRLLGRSTWEY